MATRPVSGAQKNHAVAHCVYCYLPVTETWIYTQLAEMRRYQPAVFTSSTENLDAFPFRDIFVYERCSHRSLRPWERSALRWVPQYPSVYSEPMRQRGVRLIHAHFGDEGFRLLAVRAKLNIPMIVTFYGWDLSALPKRGPLGRWRLWLRLLFLVGDAFLAEGNHMRESLIELGCPPQKVQVQHLGVDLRRLPFGRRSLPADGPVRVLIAATFREKKGIRYGIDAFARLAKTRRQLELVIVGDGPLRPQIERQIADLNLEHRVRLVGYQSYESLIDIAENSHLVLAPSITADDGDAEGGAPVFLIEAQAMGLPVVATTHADIPEVVLDGQSGFLSAERDVEGLASNLELALSLADHWPEMGELGRKRVDTEYNLELQVPRLEQVYDEVLRHRNA